ncbi:hypothetical protein NE619_17965, partial [Anaerovorax odorimutans]
AADMGTPTRAEPTRQTQILPAAAAVATQAVETAAAPVQPAVPVQAAPTQPANSAAQQAMQPQTQPAAAVPTQAAAYTQEQLALAASQLMEAKKDQSVVINLLGKFGVQALTQLPKEQYGAFATELRALGAKL